MPCESITRSAPLLSGAEAKRQSTLLAQAACLGVIVAPLADDAGRPEWRISRGPLTVTARDLDDLEAWLRRFAGVAHAAQHGAPDSLVRCVARSLAMAADVERLNRDLSCDDLGGMLRERGQPSSLTGR